MKKYDFRNVKYSHSDIFGAVLCNKTIRVDDKELYLFYISYSMIGIMSYSSYIGYIKYDNTTPYPSYEMYIFNTYKHYSRTTSKHISYLRNYFNPIFHYIDWIDKN